LSPLHWGLIFLEDLLNYLLSTWVEVLDIIPLYFDYFTGEFKYGLTKSKVIRTIESEQSEIISSLNSYYSKLITSKPKIVTLSLTSNKTQDFIGNPSFIEMIKPISLVYTIKFTSDTEFTVTSDIGETVTSNKTTDTILSDITIKKEFFNNLSSANNDVIFVSVSCYDPILIGLVSKFTAAFLLDNTYIEQTTGNSSDATALRTYVNKKVNSLINLSTPNQLSVPRNELSAEPEYTGYIDRITEFGGERKDL
jgi:hypothetical protein